MPFLQASHHASCLCDCHCHKHHMDIAVVQVLLHPLFAAAACAIQPPPQRILPTGSVTCMTVKGLAAVPLMSSSPLFLRSSCTDGGWRKMTVFTLNLICSSGS